MFASIIYLVYSTMQKFLTLDMGQFCHNQFSIYQLKFARFSSQAKQNFSTTDLYTFLKRVYVSVGILESEVTLSRYS